MNVDHLDLLRGRRADDRAPALHRRVRHLRPRALAGALERPRRLRRIKPQVAVLIPAYNEEKVIERTVRSALDSDYPNLRVIVIDDGSSDRTLEVARRAFAQEEAEGRVLILTKPNSGQGRGAQLWTGASDATKRFSSASTPTRSSRTTPSRIWCRTS